jgi:hypothetical protein
VKRTGKGRNRAVAGRLAAEKARAKARQVKSAPAKAAKSKPAVSRARATTPARTTHAPVLLPKPKKRTPLPHPLPTRHVAPPPPVLVAPARSMPPLREALRKAPQPAPPVKLPIALPQFGEAGMMLTITYSIRDGRRNDFFDLMRELKPLLAGIGGLDCIVYEDRSRPNYFMEVFRFRDEAEFTAFDDKFHKDRKIAAIYALLDDIVEAEKSDFKIFERRL